MLTTSGGLRCSDRDRRQRQDGPGGRRAGARHGATRSTPSWAAPRTPAAERSRRSGCTGADVAVEFTRPDAVARQPRAADRAGIPAVTGTTGWEAELPRIAALVERAGRRRCSTPPTSRVGVHLFLRAARDLAPALRGRARIRRLYTGGASRRQARRAVRHRARAPGTRLREADRRRGPSRSPRSGPAPRRARTGCAYDGPYETVTLAHDRPEPGRLRRRRARGGRMAARAVRGVFTFEDMLFGDARMTRFEGCGTALVTPFTDDGALDLPALARAGRVADRRRDRLPGALRLHRRGADPGRRRARAGRRDAWSRPPAGRVPGHGRRHQQRHRRAVDETRRMCALGVDSSSAPRPTTTSPRRTASRRHFRAVADASTRPVCLYNVPGRTAVNLAARHGAPPGRAPERDGHQGSQRRPAADHGDPPAPPGRLRRALGRRLAGLPASRRPAATG